MFCKHLIIWNALYIYTYTLHLTLLKWVQNSINYWLKQGCYSNTLSGLHSSITKSIHAFSPLNKQKKQQQKLKSRLWWLQLRKLVGDKSWSMHTNNFQLQNLIFTNNGYFSINVVFIDLSCFRFVYFIDRTKRAIQRTACSHSHTQPNQTWVCSKWRDSVDCHEILCSCSLKSSL